MQTQFRMFYSNLGSRHRVSFAHGRCSGGRTPLFALLIHHMRNTNVRSAIIKLPISLLLCFVEINRLDRIGSDASD